MKTIISAKTHRSSRETFYLS